MSSYENPAPNVTRELEWCKKPPLSLWRNRSDWKSETAFWYL